MAEEKAPPGRDEILAHLLSPDAEQPRDEPAIAANIGEQLTHMGLSTWSISILRRIRDAIARLDPTNVLEVGAGIGHRSAWLFDTFERSDSPPEMFTMVEQGAKFGVILHRLMTRYEAESRTNIVVGEPLQLAAEHAAWALASTTMSEISNTPFESTYDAIIIDAPSPERANLVSTYLPLLSQHGVLFTVEPAMPTGEVEEHDEAGMALVNGFNAWIELIHSSNSTHHIGFMPVFGGTLVAWLPHDS